MKLLTPSKVLAFVKEKGVVLEAAKGPAPCLIEAILASPIKGNWWGHPKANLIYNLTRMLRDSSQILTCRLIQNKITFVHQRLWTSIVRLKKNANREGLSMIREVHTKGGAHKVITTPFPRWVPGKIQEKAHLLSEEQARANLKSWIHFIET